MKMHKDTRAVIRALERDAREFRAKAFECEGKGLSILATTFRNLALAAERQAAHYRRY